MDTNDKNNPVVTISAEELHRILLKTHRIGNRNRLKFIRALYALYESRLYLKLSSTGIAPYAAKYFGLKKTKTFEYLRVAGVLEEIPMSVEKFNAGEISWSVLKEISRVATAETEETWLEWAREKPFRQLRAEVQDALMKNRALPRKGGYGISNLTTALVFKLTLEEHDLVSKAFQKIGGELLESIGGEGPLDPKTVLLYMARRFLETDPAGTPPERVEKDSSIYTLLYRTCPKCLISHVSTSEGPVEVPHEHIERIEAEAKKVVINPQEEIAKPQDTGADAQPGVVIDRPNPPSLVKKVILRDGARCANPMCGRRNVPLHAHHIRQRSEGGPTELFNETAVCLICHSMLHMALIAVTGDPLTGLEWTRAADRIVLSPDAEKEDLAKVPMVVVVKESGRPNSLDRKSAPDNSSLETSLQWVVLGLMKLGYTKTEGKERAREAYLRLKAQLGREPQEKEIFEAAVRRN